MLSKMNKRMEPLKAKDLKPLNFELMKLAARLNGRLNGRGYRQVVKSIEEGRPF